VDSDGTAEPIRAERAAAALGADGYIGQFDAYRVVACAAVVLQHSLLWTVAGGNVVAWAFVMLLHFSRTAFFFLSSLLLTYTQLTRPRSTLSFWKRRFVQLGVPYLAWTTIYWVDTLLTAGGAPSRAWPLFWHDLVYGYYQLYFAAVLLQLYVVWPFLFRFLRARRHHGRVMAVSLFVALLLAADLHWPGAFGVVGHATVRVESMYPWARDPFTYQEQFVAGILVGLHLDQIGAFVRRWGRAVVTTGAALGVAATLWYLVAVWTGSSTGRASDLYQPIAFLWFTGAVAALECLTWWWWQRVGPRDGGPPGRWARVATKLSDLTSGIFFSHVLFITPVRSALDDWGIASHVGWAGTVALTYVATLGLAGGFTALVLKTPARWVLTGPLRAEQRRRLGTSSEERGAIRAHELAGAGATVP